MTKVPEEIHAAFLDFLLDNSPIEAFEQWVYGNVAALEQALTPDDTLALLSINYARKGSSYEVAQILERYIDLAVVETWRLAALLRQFFDDAPDLLRLLAACYDAYCGGYYFMEPFLYFYLSLGVDAGRHLTEEQSAGLLQAARHEAEQGLKWIEQGAIVLTGEEDEIGHLGYVDRCGDVRS